MGRRRKSDSPLHGVILIDKPSGKTSRDVVSAVGRLTGQRRAGHTGTLDPMATGLLPVVLGEGTKAAALLSDAHKVYAATLQLGVATDCGDAEGQEVERGVVPELNQGLVEQACSTLLGRQMQTPPVYSAKKVDGKRAYDLARQGIEVALTPVEIEVASLECRWIAPGRIELTAEVSKGTYIRSLGETLAKRLETVGHLTALRRLRTGPFDVADAITLDQLEALGVEARAAAVLPVARLLALLPSCTLDGAQTARFTQGIKIAGVVGGGVTGQVAVFGPDRLLGIAWAQEGAVQPKRLFLLNS